MRIAVLSDIHGNLTALEEVVKDMNCVEYDEIILLGDLIDYGMQSNEVVDFIQNHLEFKKILCNIWGNHERAILREDYTGFSSERGINSAKHTACMLTEKTKNYLMTKLNQSGAEVFTHEGYCILCIHGSLDDHYWKAICSDTPHGDYREYDVVFSGHSHESHMFSKYYETNAMEYRNKHKVLFINPGSVGQPRNHNPNAQYAIFDTKSGSVELRCVRYDLHKIMDLYDGSVDDFYRRRLEYGV